MEENQQVTAGGNKKMLLIGGAVVVLILLIGVTMILGKKKSTSQNQVAAVVAGKKIYQQDVENEAKKQYAASAIDSKVMANTLDELKQLTLIKSQAEKDSITVNPNDVSLIAQSRFPDQNNIPQAFKDQIYNDLLKEKVIEKNVKSKRAYVIDLWIPSPDYASSFSQDEQATFEAQRKVRDAVIDVAVNSLNQGKSPESVVAELDQKYTAVEPKLALNGVVYSGSTDKSIFRNPELVYKEHESDNYPVLTAVSGMKNGEVKSFVNLDGQGDGFIVVQLISSNDKGYSSYDAFIQAINK